jgi:hypothetical protein
MSLLFPVHIAITRVQAHSLCETFIDVHEPLEPECLPVVIASGGVEEDADDIVVLTQYPRRGQQRDYIEFGHR